MPAVVYAFPERARRAVQIATFITSRERRSATSAGDLSAHRQATEHSTRRPHPLVLSLTSLGKVAGSAGLRSTRDRDRVAAQRLSRSLDAHEQSREARQTLISEEIRELIRKISDANPLGGTPRIVGEPGKLGINVAKSTVDKYRVRSRRAPSPTWKAFLKNHVHDLVSIDFFIVSTIRF